MTKQDKPNSPESDPNDADTTDTQWTEADEVDLESSTSDAPTRPRSKAERRSGSAPAGTKKVAAADEVADDRRPGRVDSRAAGRVDSRDGGREISLTLNARTLYRTLAALVVVALVVGIALLAWGFYQRGAKLDAFDDVKATSRDFSGKLVSTMNTENAGNMKELLGPLSTGEFREHLAQQQSEGQQAVQKLNVKATSTIKSVSVERFDTSTAKTSVLMEVTGTSSLAPDGGKEMMLIWLELRHEDGKWLVAKLDGAQAGIGGAQGEQGRQGGQAPQQNAPQNQAPQNQAPQNQTPQNQAPQNPAPQPAPGG